MYLSNTRKTSDWDKTFVIHDLKATNKSETLPPFSQYRMLCIIVYPSIRVASGTIFLTDFSTFNASFKSALDVRYLPSPVLLNNDVGIGASSYEKESFFYFLSSTVQYP